MVRSLRRDLTTFITLQKAMVALQSEHGVRILIVDACRSRPGFEAIESLDRPLTRAVRVARGLAQIRREDVPHGMYIARAVLKHLPTPGLDIRVLFGRVRPEVKIDTYDKQHTESVDGMIGDFVLKAAR